MAASTGSPASRRSTKLTPLTTRPSLTSRQGITRTLNMDSLLGRSARVADQRQRRFHILDGSKTARRDDGNRDPLGECDGRVEIEALEQAVARDVGKDDRGDAGILKSLRDFERGHLRGLGPAFDRDLAVAGVET